MKQIIFSFFFLILFLFLPQGIVFAHTLDTNNGVGAVMHIEPDDDPIALAKSIFFLEFKDESGKFSFIGCNCEASIYAQGKKIFSQPLNRFNEMTASFAFTFPEMNVYQLRIEGSPKEKGQFNSFSLSYDIRVARTAKNLPLNIKNDWLGSHVIHIAAILTVFLVIATILIKSILTKKK